MPKTNLFHKSELSVVVNALTTEENPDLEGAVVALCREVQKLQQQVETENKQPHKTNCTWEFDCDENSYFIECLQEEEFLDLRTGMKYCPFCGSQIKVKELN